MDLANFADLTDLLAALGVIASLVYVGYQIKETRKAVRAATAQARTDLGVQLISSRYTSDIADVLVKSLSDPDSLTKSERFKLKSFFQLMCDTVRIFFINSSRGCWTRISRLVWRELPHTGSETIHGRQKSGSRSKRTYHRNFRIS